MVFGLLWIWYGIFIKGLSNEYVRVLCTLNINLMIFCEQAKIGWTKKYNLSFSQTYSMHIILSNDLKKNLPIDKSMKT